MMPNFEEWAYELADESETFTGRAEAIEAKLRQAYKAGQDHRSVIEPMLSTEDQDQRRAARSPKRTKR